jgi:hypothetical protein
VVVPAPRSTDFSSAHLATQQHIQIRQRLVHQQHSWFDRQWSGNGDALAPDVLAAVLDAHPAHRAAKGIDASINGIGQDVVDTVVERPSQATKTASKLAGSVVLAFRLPGVRCRAVRKRVRSRLTDTLNPMRIFDVMDPFVTLSAAAAVTTAICLNIRRDTIQTAKLVASLEQVSKGRFLSALAVAGMPGDGRPTHRLRGPHLEADPRPLGEADPADKMLRRRN